MKPIAFMNLTELRKLLLSKKLSVRQLTSYYLKRISAYDGAHGLNAVREINPQVMEEADRLDEEGQTDRPLFGMPILIKDNIDVGGLHTTAGSAALIDHIAAEDAPVVKSLRKAGAVILGKTNMTEFANFLTYGMPGGFSSAGGQVINAYDRSASPSGSSSGSAVALSAGFCAAALGTDTSFSVVGCVTVHGLCGLKPPHGVLPAKGVVPISKTLDSVGILARNMQDTLTVYGALIGKTIEWKEIPAENLKLSVNLYHKEMVSEEQRRYYSSLLDDLKTKGTTVTEIYREHTPHLPRVMKEEFREDLEDYLRSAGVQRKTLKEIIAYYEDNPSSMPYGIRHLTEAQSDAGRKSEVYLNAMKVRENEKQEMARQLDEFDACLMTGPTYQMHYAGFPSLSVPMCMGSDGMPRGLILYGADEEKLIRAAMTVEKFCSPIIPPYLPELSNEIG